MSATEKTPAAVTARRWILAARRAATGVAIVAMAGFASCAPDFSEPIPDVGITEQEITEGADDTGEDHVEPTEGIDGEGVGALAPELAAEDTDGDPNTSTNTAEATACRRATGYVAGRPRSICVTSVDGKLVEVNTARAYRRMQAAARRSGVYISVVSGFRTMQRQRELYACYRAGRCPLAARPGYSNHQSGLALDLNTSARGVYSWLSRHGASYGFRRTVPSEAWHWERR